MVSRRTALLVRIITLAVFLAAWQLYGSDPLHFAVSPPTAVVGALWEQKFELALRTVDTLTVAAVGILLSVAVGLVLGFAIPLFPWAKNTLDPLVDALYAMPVTMLIPIIGVYTGLGFRGRVFVVFMYMAMIVVITTAAGVRDVDKGLIEAGRSFGARGLTLWRKVIFPAALAHILAGLSLAVARAIRGAVTAELILVATALGGFILRAGSTFNMPVLYAGVVWTVLLGYLAYAAASWLESRLLRWRTLRAVR